MIDAAVQTHEDALSLTKVADIIYKIKVAVGPLG